MKLELKTENDRFSALSFSSFNLSAIILSLIILSNISIKLGNISRYYESNYFCKLLIIEKSSSSFKKLSKLLNQTNNQKIWDICKEIIK